jgi:hypothetical protein
LIISNYRYECRVPQASIHRHDTRVPSTKIGEKKPATSAITSLRDDEVTERCHGYHNYFFWLAQSLDTAPKPYYFGSKNPYVRAVFTTALLDLASVRSTRATAANHRQLINACRRDELGVANSNVTSEVTG